MKKIFILLILYFFSACLSFGFDLDETVDDAIRKNYNSTKLIEDTGIEKYYNNKSSVNSNTDLPELPNITKTNTTKKNTNTVAVPKQSYNPAGLKNITIHKGSVLPVKSLTNISDYQTAGTKIEFKYLPNTNKKLSTIPAGIILRGQIINSHIPQITCNGGSVVIKINEISYNGSTAPVSAYIVNADGKKIFFNNIKGQRTYLKTMWKKGNWGRALFSRCMTMTVNLGSEGSTLLLAPFPFLYGTLCFGLNTLTSPVTAFFSKGGHLSIPSGSNFKIKFEETFSR